MNNTNNESPEQKPLDPFDLSQLRLDQSFVNVGDVKKILTTIPVRKPSKEWFIRTHPDPTYRLPTCVLELKEDNEIYLVRRELWDHLLGESAFVPKILVPTINRQGVLILWPIRLPGSDGKLDDWNASAMDAADRAKNVWLRIQSNRSLGAYEVYEAGSQDKEPIWPKEAFGELLKIAFKNRLIENLNHPVLKRLRGES